MSFEQFSLHPNVMAGVESVGFTNPTPIQEQAIPYAMEGRDVLGLAQTGTGKTAAFVLPILHHLATTPPKKGIRALVIAPTRELAEQIRETFRDLGTQLPFRAISIYGGVAKGPQLSGVRRGAQIVVACPGRLLDHVSQKDIDLSQVEMLVLDEADTMCDMGFLPDVRRILGRIPDTRQTLLLSATMPKEIRSLAVSILKDPATVQIGTIAPAKTVSHALYPVPDNLKKNLLIALLEQTATGRALVFTRTKHRARTLAFDLAKSQYRVTALQGNMSQTARQQAMNGFRDGKFDILVATDIAAHGIDVPEVSHVINFDFPNTADTYTHRIGRTGRAEQTGEAFTLAAATDGAMVREVEKELGRRIERRRLPGFNYGDFAPELQFPERRPSQEVRTAGRGNGSGPSRNTPSRGPGGGPKKYRSNGPSNNENQFENGKSWPKPSNRAGFSGPPKPGVAHVEGRAPRPNSPNGNRFESGDSRPNPLNSRRFEGGDSRPNSANGNRFEGGPSRPSSPNGRRFEGGDSRPNPTNGNRFESGPSRPSSSNGNQFEGGDSRPSLSNDSRFNGGNSRPNPANGRRFAGKASSPTPTGGRQFEGGDSRPSSANGPDKPRMRSVAAHKSRPSRSSGPGGPGGPRGRSSGRR